MGRRRRRRGSSAGVPGLGGLPVRTPARAAEASCPGHFAPDSIGKPADRWANGSEMAGSPITFYGKLKPPVDEPGDDLVVIGHRVDVPRPAASSGQRRNYDAPPVVALGERAGPTPGGGQPRQHHAGIRYGCGWRWLRPASRLSTAGSKLGPKRRRRAIASNASAAEEVVDERVEHPASSSMVSTWWPGCQRCRGLQRRRRTSGCSRRIDRVNTPTRNRRTLGQSRRRWRANFWAAPSLFRPPGRTRPCPAPNGSPPVGDQFDRHLVVLGLQRQAAQVGRADQGRYRPPYPDGAAAVVGVRDRRCRRPRRTPPNPTMTPRCGRGSRVADRPRRGVQQRR